MRGTHNISEASVTGNTTESVRESYDRIASEYANHFANELDSKPLDRELLGRLAADVRGKGFVCDMGCGPGHIARFLGQLGTKMFGLDLSPGMIEQARRINPDIPFQVGDMTSLELEDGTLAGIAAFYAIVNIPRDSLLTVFKEMFRVLQAAGLLLLSFHIGEEVVHPDELLGHPISMDFFFFQPHLIKGLLETAGFVIEEIIEREPYAPGIEYQSRRAYIFARKPI